MPFRLSDQWFQYIHTHFLVYNTSWEDADIDRELLKLNHKSSVLMITGAGCNALAYLLDSPTLIHSVDRNFRQNALLELKLALFNKGDFKKLEVLFLTGKNINYKIIYDQIRNSLSRKSRDFWDRHIRYFSASGPGFYYSGTSGLFAKSLNKILDIKGLRPQVNQLFTHQSRQKRAALYAEIETELWAGFSQYLWKWNGALSLAGVPATQAHAVDDLNHFMKKALPKLFVEQNPAENYYWRVYLKGAYTKDCCPDFLREKNFNHIRNRTSTIHFETVDIIQHLQQTEVKYSHFVLLDHMDWIAEKNTSLLEKEWRLILKCAAPAAKILFRTAYPNLEFLPDFIFDFIDFTNADDLGLKHPEKVGTYTGTYLGIVK